MLKITNAEKNKVSGQAAIEESLAHAPTVGLFAGLKILDVHVGNPVGQHFTWSFEWDEQEITPHGIVILETSEICLFNETELDPWLKFIISNVQKQFVRCTFTDYARSGMFSNAQLIELLYIDLLARGVDQGGMHAYLEATATGLPWSSVRSNLIGSEEFANRHLTVFDRIGRVFQFQTLTTEALERAASAPRGIFDIKQYEHLANDEFCRVAYQKVLAKNPDAQGLTFYVWALNTGRLTRSNAVRRMLQDIEQENPFLVPSLPHERPEIVIEIGNDASPEDVLARIEKRLGTPIDATVKAEWLEGEHDLSELSDKINSGWDPFFSRLKLIEAK